MRLPVPNNLKLFHTLLFGQHTITKPGAMYILYPDVLRHCPSLSCQTESKLGPRVAVSLPVHSFSYIACLTGALENVQVAAVEKELALEGLMTP